MTSICVIGNSHISAFVRGWEQLRNDHPNVELEFFGAPGSKMRDLGVKDGSLVPCSSELEHYFTLTSEKKQIASNYDYFMLCGLRLGLLHMDYLFDRWRPEAVNPDHRVLLSDKCFARSLEGCVLASPVAEIIVKLREITGAPIIVVPDPLPTENFTKCDFINRAEQRGEEQVVAGFFDAACTRVCRELNVRCCLQVPSTKSGFLRTREEYSRGSMRLRTRFSAPHKGAPGIAKHMNAEFGGIMLRKVFAELALGS